MLSAPASPLVAKTMLQDIVRTLAVHPGDTPDQMAARAETVATTVLSLQPRDPMEMMFAGMAVTHLYLGQDAAGDAMRGKEGTLKARARTAVLGFDRMVLRAVKELRTAQKRDVAGWAMPEPAVEEAAPPDEPAQEPEAARPLRPAAASVPAMMAVLSPPTRPFPQRPAVRRIGPDERPGVRPPPVPCLATGRRPDATR